MSTDHTECVAALTLGSGALAEQAGDYKLVAATNDLAAGPSRWRLTYKLTKLLPSQPGGLVGKGGEVFVAVDVASGKAEITGLGE